MNDIERGNLAAQVLSNEAYQEAYSLVEKELIRLWQQEKSPDVRESLWVQQTLLAKVRTQLEAAITNGKLQRRNLPQRAMDLVRSGTSGMR